MLFDFLVTKAQAAVTNPAIGTLGSDDAAAASGALFATYFLRIWNAVISVGGLMVIIYFLWGSIDWISAGGDSAKIGKARDRMVQAVIGLTVLLASFAILGFIGPLFFGEDFDLLKLTFGI